MSSRNWRTRRDRSAPAGNCHTHANLKAGNVTQYQGDLRPENVEVRGSHTLRRLLEACGKYATHMCNHLAMPMADTVNELQPSFHHNLNLASKSISTQNATVPRRNLVGLWTPGSFPGVIWDLPQSVEDRERLRREAGSPRLLGGRFSELGRTHTRLVLGSGKNGIPHSPTKS